MADARSIAGKVGKKNNGEGDECSVIELYTLRCKEECVGFVDKNDCEHGQCRKHLFLHQWSLLVRVVRRFDDRSETRTKVKRKKSQTKRGRERGKERKEEKYPLQLLAASDQRCGTGPRAESVWSLRSLETVARTLDRNSDPARRQLYTIRRLFSLSKAKLTRACIYTRTRI